MFVRTYINSTIPAAPLARLRVLFGLLMTFSSVRFIMLGWVQDQYIEPTIHFPYYGFEWVTSLGNPGMYVVFGAMTLSAVFITLGLAYRLSSVVFFLLFTYVELIDKTYYLNHYYFVSLVAFLFCIVPAHTTLSLDAKFFSRTRRDTVPRWTLDIFKFQILIVYLYAGLAKINTDWLFDAMPLRIWLPAHTDIPVIGWLFAVPWIPWVFAWAGMLYDVFVPFMLLNKRTRPLAYVSVIVFHVITGMLFQIGVFPLVMIGMTLVFFYDAPPLTTETPSPTAPKRGLLVGSLCVYAAIQILVPWRFLIYPGELFWTEEGYRFSWRVMLMEKSGSVTFTVEDRRTGRRGIVDNRSFLNAHQEKQMAMQPDMILQFAHVLRDHYQKLGLTDPKVTADAWVTLNGAPSAQLIDPRVDLTRESMGFHPYSWILAR